MRYIRFLKTPRVTLDKHTSKAQLSCLVTITSDLGDSFLHHHLPLSAELLDANTDKAVVWQTVLWTGGRSLPVSFPLSKSWGARPVRVRVGVDPRAAYDEFGKLQDEEFRGTVSAWSAPMDPSASGNEAEKLVERRFGVADEVRVCLWEETGESIARHLWDAGITLACHVGSLLGDNPSPLLPASDLNRKSLQVVELGAGCGVVGITIARLRQDAYVVLTDLPEAREIIEHNLKQIQQPNIQFLELNWEEDIPRGSMTPADLIIAADCTYNADSSPAFVKTIQSIAESSLNVTVAIAMKIRHSSEEVFFELMREAGFRALKAITYPLPGDETNGEETVHLYTYSYDQAVR